MTDTAISAVEPAVNDGSNADAARATGPAAAALVAAGVGTFVLGLLALLSEVSEPIHDALPWVSSVGPLSGKVFISIIVWVVVWGVGHAVWRRRNPDIVMAGGITAGLVLIGVALMLPPIWKVFGA